MERHTKNAEELFAFLKTVSLFVENIYYPFDENNPQYEIAKSK